MLNSRKLTLAAALLIGGMGYAIAQGGAGGGDGAGSGGSGGAAGASGAAAGAGSSGGGSGSAGNSGSAEQRQTGQSDSRPAPGSNPDRSTTGGIAGSPGTKR